MGWILQRVPETPTVPYGSLELLVAKPLSSIYLRNSTWEPNSRHPCKFYCICGGRDLSASLM
ncbi:hypothetical protein LEMLEM_LOCUS22949 [Lemmus lemmus]